MKAASKPAKQEAPKSFDDMSPEEQEKALGEARKGVAEFAKTWGAADAMSIEVLGQDGVKGAGDDAKVTVIEFADFDCPHCRLAGYYVKDLAHRYGDQVRFVFKNYPLGSKCNDGLSRHSRLRLSHSRKAPRY